MALFKHDIVTSAPQELRRITSSIEDDIRASGIREGIAVVWCPHTTAGITVNENADPDVRHDIIFGYEHAFPTRDAHYEHCEGNSHAHMKSSLVGASQTLIIKDGALLLGTWQTVYFCEFDGPRDRRFFVKLMEG